MTFPDRFAEPRWRARGLAVAFALAVAIQLYHLYGLHVAKDLPLWDESAYIGWGDEFRQDGKVGSITNAPFYHVLYAAVISVVGLLPSFYAMQYLLKLLLTALVFILVARFSRSSSLALLVGVFFAYSHYHLNSEVLVYYAGLVPYLGAILVACRRPGLGLGLSFLASLGRLEYLVVPLLHFLFLVFENRKKRARGFAFSWRRLGGAMPAAGVWLLNGFILTRVTVWQLHNRVWFAWSQNYASFRYLTGRDQGGNPWLDHQSITERDFPQARSLSEAFSVNPVAVLEHTWFNVRLLPNYLADFFREGPDAGGWINAPLFVLAAIAGAGVLALAWRRARNGENSALVRLGELRTEAVLCLGGVVAALPGLVVSSKTNYVMSALPAALFGFCLLHVSARRMRVYARWSGPAFVALAVVFGIHSLLHPPVYSQRKERGPVHEDVRTIRSILAPFKGLELLGVSTSSYINYLGRENGHRFVEPLAISPVNAQAADLSLTGLVREHQPDVLLVNHFWRSSQTYASTVEGFSFAEWDRHALRDGELYTRRDLILRPVFDHRWHEEERGDGRVWRWSMGDAAIDLENASDRRPVTVRFALRSLVSRKIVISLPSGPLFEGNLEGDARREIELKIEALPAGLNRLEFRTDLPAVIPAGGDTRNLAFCIEDLAISQGP